MSNGHVCMCMDNGSTSQSVSKPILPKLLTVRESGRMHMYSCCSVLVLNSQAHCVEPIDEKRIKLNYVLIVNLLCWIHGNTSLDLNYVRVWVYVIKWDWNQGIVAATLHAQQFIGTIMCIEFNRNWTIRYGFGVVLEFDTN